MRVGAVERGEQGADEPSHDASEPARSPSRRLDAVLAALLIVGAAILRGPSLAPDGFFRDDAWAALATRAGNVPDLFVVGSVAPGFALVLRIWSSIAGRSTLALQMPAFVAGVLLPAAVYLLARTWKRHQASALFSAAIVLTAQWAVTYSARVKSFSVDALLVVGLLALGHWVAQRPRLRRRWIVLTTAAIGALFFSAATAGGAVFALAVPAVRAWRAGARRMAGIAVGLFAVVALGWYFVVLGPASTDELHDFWRDSYAPITDGPSSVSAMAHLWRDFFTAAAPLRASSAIGLLLAVAVLAGALTLAASRRWGTLALLGGPLVLAAGAAALSVAPFGGGRTDVYLLPCVALLAGACLEGPVSARAPHLVLPVVAGAVVVVLLVASGPALKGTYPDEDLSATVSWVGAQLEPGDRVVVYPETTYEWAIYTTEHITLVRDARAMSAFSPRSADGRVLLLPGYEIASSADRTLAYRAESAHAVSALADDASVTRIFVVTSTLFPGDGLPEIAASLTDAGFRRGPDYANRQGLVQQWTRSS